MNFRQGEIIYVSLDLSSGHKQNKRRPVLVISNDVFNAKCSLRWVCPITSVNNGYPLHVPITTANDEQIDMMGFVEVEQTKALDLKARKGVVSGRVDYETLNQVAELAMACINFW